MKTEDRERIKIYESNRMEAGGRSYFSLAWPSEEKGGGRSYIRETLALGCCKSYLPMAFVGEEENSAACYDDTDYIPLEHFLEGQLAGGRGLLRTVVQVLRKLTEGEEAGEDFLLSADEILLRLDYVFVSAEGAIAMAYVPRENSQSFSHQLLMLSKEIADRWQGEELSLLWEKLERELESNTPGTKGLLRLLSRWERELS